MKKARNAIFVFRVGAVQHSWSRAGWRATVTLLHIVPETARQSYIATARHVHVRSRTRPAQNDPDPDAHLTEKEVRARIR